MKLIYTDAIDNNCSNYWLEINFGAESLTLKLIYKTFQSAQPHCTIKICQKINVGM